jgi:protein SCO1/2
MKTGTLIILFLTASLLACQKSPSAVPTFHATDITGASFARDFELPDHNGKTRKLADFRGKVVALFFGYTHCPDVCPTTLSDFASALKSMGADGQQVQVLFVTLDPDRDTPALLQRYVPAFNPAFLGLHPDQEQLKSIVSEYKVVYQKTPSLDKDDYLIDHSAGTYVYDPQGRLRLLIPYGSGAEAIAHDLKALLR